SPSVDALDELRAMRRAPHGPRLGHGAVRHLFAPLVLLGALLPWLRAGPTGLTLTSTTLPAATGPALLVAMLFVWLAEQLYPGHPDWNARPLTQGLVGWRRLGRDLFYLFGVTWLSSALISAADP